MRFNDRLSSRWTKALAGAAFGGALLLCSALGAADVEEFASGELLTAAKLNTNLLDLQSRIQAAEEATPVITQWQSYTPVLMTNTNAPVAGATSAGHWRRVGDTIEVRIRTRFSGPPQSGAAWWHWSLPPGVSLDSAKLGINDPLPTGAHLGSGSTQQGLGNNVGLSVWYRSLTTMSATAHGAGTYYITDNVPFAWTTDGEMSIQFAAPVQGWQ